MVGTHTERERIINDNTGKSAKGAAENRLKKNNLNHRNYKNMQVCKLSVKERHSADSAGAVGAPCEQSTDDYYVSTSRPSCISLQTMLGRSSNNMQIWQLAKIDLSITLTLVLVLYLWVQLKRQSFTSKLHFDCIYEWVSKWNDQWGICILGALIAISQQRKIPTFLFSHSNTSKYS